MARSVSLLISFKSSSPIWMVMIGQSGLMEVVLAAELKMNSVVFMVAKRSDCRVICSTVSVDVSTVSLNVR